MNQDLFFFCSEGNYWFQRNQASLNDANKFDWPCYLIDFINEQAKIEKVVELGCANGYRLNKLKNKIKSAYFVGVDASIEAVQDGRIHYPELNLHQGLISQVPLQEEFDLVIVNFVLHWVDRRTLVRSLAEIDRLTKENGFLILGDFLPDFQQRRHYHHCPTEKIYTYKQDYAKIFESIGTYKELVRITFNHDKPELGIQTCESAFRGVCVVLRKSLYGFYPDFS